MKAIVKSLLSRTRYRISGSGALNRFDAIPEVLASLAARGFHPTRVIDGGANVGNFAQMVRGVFPNAIVDMIEPQPACQDALRALAAQDGYHLHPYALVSPADSGKSISLTTTPDVVSTGAHVQMNAGDLSVGVPSATLDELVASSLGDGDRVLLKLDLQGYELEAMSGGEAVLRHTEVILIEVSFFAQAYEPPIATLIAWLGERDFSLHDIAALKHRARDGRAHQADFVFVRRDSALAADTRWY